MLTILRHKGVAKKILWIVTGIIILSFAIFGSAYRLDNQLNSAGSLYGKSVSYRDFQQAYLDSRDQSILLYGDQFFKKGQSIDLEAQTWDRLILLKEAKKQRIKITDQEIVDFIAQVPFFQRQGQFETSTYQMIVKNPQVFNRNVRDFEEGIRRNLAIRKIFENLTHDMNISEDELKKEFTMRHEKITLDYVLFNPADFTKNVTVKDEDVLAYYQAHLETFRQAPMIKVDYVHLPVDEKATEAQKKEAKKNIYNLSAQLTATTDFAEVAKKQGLSVTSSDYFTHDQPLLTFASNPEETEKMFAMKKGEFTKPLNVPDGWQIVRINDKKESHVPVYEEIKEDVRQNFINNAAYESAKLNAEEIYPKLVEALKTSDFKTASSKLKLNALQTPAFSRGEYIANVGLVQELQQETNKLTLENPLSNVIPTSQGPVIVHLAKQDPIEKEEYEQGKEEFKNMFEAQRRQQKIGLFMNQMRLSANVSSKIKRK